MSNQQRKLENDLFNTPLPNLSEHEANLLFEQYKLFVDMMDKISERRYKANTFFLTLNSFFITALVSFSTSLIKNKFQFILLLASSLIGIIFSYTWYRMIYSYSQLNEGKFKVIHLLETRLPAKIFKVEWDLLKKGDGSVYTPFNRTEKLVPLTFVLLYFFLAVFSIIALF